MKWEQDLIRDIRRNNGTDDRDLPDRCYGPPPVWPPGWAWKNNSDENQKLLTEQFLLVRDNCSAILEIGISREGPDSFTNIFLQNKKPETIYVGIDVEDKSYINNKQQNIFTIKDSSSNYEFCTNIFNYLGIVEFDFIFIDGWHSVNQVLVDWEYTNFLSKKGIVGFHDTKYHPGPKLFVEALDKNKWNVIENAVNNEQDWGIGFAWLK